MAVGGSVGVNDGVVVGTGISGAQDTRVNTAKQVINNNRLILVSIVLRVRSVDDYIFMEKDAFCKS